MFPSASLFRLCFAKMHHRQIRRVRLQLFSIVCVCCEDATLSLHVSVWSGVGSDGSWAKAHQIDLGWRVGGWLGGCVGGWVGGRGYTGGPPASLRSPSGSIPMEHPATPDSQGTSRGWLRTTHDRTYTDQSRVQLGARIPQRHKHKPTRLNSDFRNQTPGHPV